MIKPNPSMKYLPNSKAASKNLINTLTLKAKRLLGGVLFGDMKFVLSNSLSSGDLSISYES